MERMGVVPMQEQDDHSGISSLQDLTCRIPVTALTETKAHFLSRVSLMLTAAGGSRTPLKIPVAPGRAASARLVVKIRPKEMLLGKTKTQSPLHLGLKSSAPGDLILGWHHQVF